MPAQLVKLIRRKCQFGRGIFAYRTENVIPQVAHFFVDYRLDKLVRKSHFEVRLAYADGNSGNESGVGCGINGFGCAFKNMGSATSHVGYYFVALEADKRRNICALLQFFGNFGS